MSDDVHIFKAIDEKGKVYNLGNGTKLEESGQEDGYYRTIRTAMTKLNSTSTSLTFYQSLCVADPKVQHLLSSSSFTLKSKRFNFGPQVNDVTQ